MPVIYYVITALTGVVMGLLCRRWEIGALIGYCFFVLSVTLLSRVPADGQHFEGRIFWSYGVPALREQIFFNVVAFMPVGALGGKWLGWKVIPAAAAFSTGIEVLQMIMERGLFEFDDIFHNCIGAAFGAGLLFLITKNRRKQP